MSGERLIPLTGLEQDRATTLFERLPREIHTTEDQWRMFIEDHVVAPQWHKQVADETEMLLLNTTKSRGVWPFDACVRLDTGSVFLCIANHGEDILDWFEIPIGGRTGASYIIFGGLFGQIIPDSLLGGDLTSPAPSTIIYGGDFVETVILSGGTF